MATATAAVATTTRRPSGPALSAAHYRSASPSRIKLAGAGAAARPPAGQSVSVSSPSAAAGARSRRSCMCSPTNHPGSFRCSLHKERTKAAAHGHGGGGNRPTSSPSPSPPPPAGSSSQMTTSRLGASAGRRMGSALVRIGAVEGGEWAARRALAATARPSPAAQHRRRVGGFRARPSRLSAVSVAGDRAGDNEQ